jgi:hypothetical protein
MNPTSSTKREGMVMSNGGRLLLLVVGLLGLLVTACAPSSSDAAATEPPVVVEEDAATGLKRLSLSARAAERLGIATAAVTDEAGAGLAVPYEAVLYDEHGATWTYTSPEERVFVRASITIDEIADGFAMLSAGPPVGTTVVTVGTAELWGVESGVGGGH